MSHRVIQLLFKGSYYSRAATIQGWLLFLWKTCQHQRRLEKVHKTQAIQWRLLEAVSGKCSLSVLLSVVETSRTTQTALVLAWWPSSEIICITQTALALAWWPSSEIICIRACMCVLHIPVVAAVTILGQDLFCSEILIMQWLFEGGDHSRVATIRGWRLFEEIRNLQRVLSGAYERLAPSSVKFGASKMSLIRQQYVRMQVALENP